MDNVKKENVSGVDIFDEFKKREVLEIPISCDWRKSYLKIERHCSPPTENEGYYDYFAYIEEDDNEDNEPLLSVYITSNNHDKSHIVGLAIVKLRQLLSKIDISLLEIAQTPESFI